MQATKELTREEVFYEEISDHWRQRAKKLQSRRWRALTAKDKEGQKKLQYLDI